MNAKYAIATLVAAVTLTVFSLESIAQESTSFTTDTRVGNGWHMSSTIYLDSQGVVQGKTTLKNYNNFRGFTGGLFVVALDEADTPIYTSDVHKWGINASFFKKCKTRNAEWSEQIPAEYLPKVAKIAVMQMHTPTNRVWSWVYENKDLIIRHAQYVADLYKKIKDKELTGGDVLEIVEAHF